MRSADGLLLLGAVIFSHSALAELARSAPSEDVLCLTLGAGHAESSLREEDRRDLGKSLVVRILTAVLDVLVTEHQDFSSYIKHSAMEISLIALCDELYNAAHPQQPLSSLLNRYSHPDSVIFVLLDLVADAATSVDIELHLKNGCEKVPVTPRNRFQNVAANRFSPSMGGFAGNSKVMNIQESVNNALSAISSRMSLSQFVGGLGTVPDPSVEPHIANVPGSNIQSATSNDPRFSPRSPTFSETQVTVSNGNSFVTEHIANGSESSTFISNDVPDVSNQRNSFIDGNHMNSPRSSILSGRPMSNSVIKSNLESQLISPPTPLQLAEQALSLLVVLCGPRPSSPYRSALFGMVDSTRNTSTDSHSYSFSKLYETLGKWMTHPKAALLGYYLIVGNKRFRTFSLSRTDPEVLLLPLLASLRRRCGIGAIPADAYIPATIILTLTSDKGFCEAIDTISVPYEFLRFLEDTAKIGKEEVVMSSIILLVCSRVVQQSMIMRRQNPDCLLASLAIAVMANVSGDVTNLHSFAAERLLSLVEFLGRRRKKALLLEQKLINMPRAPPQVRDSPLANGTSSPRKGFERNPERQLLKPMISCCGASALSDLLTEYIGLSLEVIVSILRSRSVVSANRHLVYTLLHREALVDIDHIANISDQTRALSHVLRRMLEFFVELVDNHGDLSHDANVTKPQTRRPFNTSSTGISVERVFHVIDQNARHLGPDIFEGLPEARFVYEEIRLAKVFLRPYSWSLATRSSELFWELDKASMPISLTPFTPTD